MRQDKAFARIFLIFSIANIALAAPAVVRQRHLDVVKAGSEKRAPPASDNGKTGNLPPESSSDMQPHDGLTNGWVESPSTAANHITTQAASGAPGQGSGATGDLPPVPSHKGPTGELSSLGSSSMAPDRISTQASGLAGSGSDATDYLTPEASSAASDHITTQALGEPGSGNGATGDLPPGPESSSAAANRITAQASGATALSPSDPVHSGGLPPHQGSPLGSLAAPEADRPFRGSLADKILLYSELTAIAGGTAALAYYGYHSWLQRTKHPYVSPVSPLSCGHLAESQTF